MSAPCFHTRPAKTKYISDTQASAPMVAGTPQVWMLKMMGAMKAKLEPRKIGTWRPVMSWNSSVPTPAPSSASEGLSPVSSGTSTSAPKATKRIWAPEIACRHNGSADWMGISRMRVLRQAHAAGVARSRHGCRYG